MKDKLNMRKKMSPKYTSETKNCLGCITNIAYMK